MKLNKEVTHFLEQQNHPLHREIDALRELIISAVPHLQENIKWNGPNYTHSGADRITMKIHPPKAIQLIFHRGAKVLEQPPARLIQDHTKLLQWKENDRAIASFKSIEEINSKGEDLRLIIHNWIVAAQ